MKQELCLNNELSIYLLIHASHYNFASHIYYIYDRMMMNYAQFYNCSRKVMPLLLLILFFNADYIPQTVVPLTLGTCERWFMQNLSQICNAVNCNDCSWLMAC